MKKISSIILIFIMTFCFSACKENIGEEYTYLPKTELYIIENSSGFHREYKIIYKYDEKGNVIKKTEYTKGFLGFFNVRERQYDIEYTYNKNGDISQELIKEQYYSFMDGHQVYNDGYNYIYNENQQLIKKENTYINPNDSKALCGYEYEYDENGNLENEYTYYSDGTKELEYKYYYDSNNVLMKKRYIANFGVSSWIENETEYTYDDEQKLVYAKTIDYAHYKDEEDTYSESKYYYDEFDRLIKRETTSFDSNGVTRNKYVNEYKDFIKK